VSRKYQEGAKEPAVTQDTLLDISRTSAVLYKRGLVRGNFMGSLPVNLGAVLRVLWRVRWVLVERLVAGGELGVTEECVVLLADLDNLRNFVVYRILLNLLTSVGHLTVHVAFAVFISTW
jgi:hypothetical protein